MRLKAIVLLAVFSFGTTAQAVGFYSPPCASEKESKDERKSVLDKCIDLATDKKDLKKNECAEELDKYIQFARQLRACLFTTKGKK